MRKSPQHYAIAALIVAVALILCLVTVRACTDERAVTAGAARPFASANARRGWRGFVGPTTTEAPVVVTEAPPEPAARGSANPTAEAPAVPAEERPQSFTSDGLNWEALRQCESGGNYADDDSPTYRGAYQFDAQTWASVGGHGDPASASPDEQDRRALRLYGERGWSPWPVCGRLL